MSKFTVWIGEEGDGKEVTGRVTLGKIKKVQEIFKFKKSSEVFQRIQEVDLDVIVELLYQSLLKYHPDVTKDELLEECDFGAFSSMAKAMASVGESKEA